MLENKHAGPTPRIVRDDDLGYLAADMRLHADAGAAIDIKVLAGDIAGAIGHQEADRFGDLLWCGKTPHGNLRHILIAELFAANGLGHGRLDQAKADRIDPNAMAAPFPGRTHGDAQNTGFGGAVVDLTYGTPPTGDGGDVDDGAGRLVAILGAVD